MDSTGRQVGGNLNFRRLLTLPQLALLGGFGAMAIPTLASLGRQTWATEAGAHGPIVLFVSIWLLARELGLVKSAVKPGKLVPALIGSAVSVAAYIFGRAFDFIGLEVAGLYGVAVSVLYSKIGLSAMRALWFPVLYLSFIIPAPGWIVDHITAPLKQFVSWAAISVLLPFGIPVSREGVTIYAGSYQLLVEDACSGMNSIIGLVAVSLLYIYLLRSAHFRYAAVLAAATVPIAILGNIVRIVTLILLTYFAGDEVAQGFLHETAGLFLFAVALILVFTLDLLLWRIFPKSWK